MAKRLTLIAGILPPLDVLAIAAAGCGALALIHGLPSGLKLLLLLAFVLVGPGCAILSRFAPVPRYALFALAPSFGIAVVVIVTAFAAIWKHFSSTTMLIAFAAATAAVALVGGLVDSRRPGRSGVEPDDGAFDGESTDVDADARYA